MSNAPKIFGLFLLLIFVSGCKQDGKKDSNKGTDPIVERPKVKVKSGLIITDIGEDSDFCFSQEGCLELITPNGPSDNYQINFSVSNESDDEIVLTNATVMIPVDGNDTLFWLNLDTTATLTNDTILPNGTVCVIRYYSLEEQHQFNAGNLFNFALTANLGTEVSDTTIQLPICKTKNFK